MALQECYIPIGHDTIDIDIFILKIKFLVDYRYHRVLNCCNWSDKHKTFKLRLPAIRRIRHRSPDQKQQKRSTGDGESKKSSLESMPLQQFSPFVERLCPPRLASGIWGHEQPVSDHDPGDNAAWNDAKYPAWKGSQTSLRKGSSLDEAEAKRSPPGIWDHSH